MHALPNIDFVFGDSSSILASRSANAKQLSGRLIATGLPISSEFFRADGAPNECSLQSRVRVLATFGGEALTAERYVPRIFEAAKSNQKLEVVFLCGNNRALRKAIASKIQESAMGDRMSALSFRSNPAPLYAGADVLVGKAGGLTVAEAIASGNSIAVISHLPGQEEYNIRALEQAGKGRVVTADEDLASALITMASKRQPPECFVRGARAMATSMQKLVLQRAGIEARS
jgi:processive 1,2-diacylglycerol beta-glucosyltransferase